MGLIKMIGKMTASKVVNKIEDEITKKQNCEQTKKYCIYINNNIVRVYKQINDLLSETKNVINNISSKNNIKSFFKERSELKKNKEKAITNLKYLYLARDFFTALSKNASEIELNNEELMLVIKFAPYFDGSPVLKLAEEEKDDSIVGAFKEMGKELKDAFVSSKKRPTDFNFEEYLNRYEEKIKEYIVPDVNSSIENFKSVTSDQKTNIDEIKNTSTTENHNKTFCENECSNCGAKIEENSKFCQQCGNKIEIKKSYFCTQCGERITVGAKYCAICGAKI